MNIIRKGLSDVLKSNPSIRTIEHTPHNDIDIDIKT